MSDQPCSTDQTEGCENPVSTTIVVDQGTPPLPSTTTVASAAPVPADVTLPATGASPVLLSVAFLAVVVGCLLLRAVRRPCGPGRVTALAASKDLVDDRVSEGSDA